MPSVDAPLHDLIGPSLLTEGEFSWRRSDVTAERLDAFERAARRWIAANRTLAPQVGRPAPYLRQALALTAQASLPEAMAAGERFAADFELGAVPAERLAEALERKLGVLVLMIDATEGVSGAECRLPDLDVVLVNRREAPALRHFHLAYELFHILTWDAMPAAHFEEASEYGESRVEQLANHFASAVLMPESVLDRFVKHLGEAAHAQMLQVITPWTGPARLPTPHRIRPFRPNRRTGASDPRRFEKMLKAAPAALGNAIAWINATADALQVTTTALKWRLAALGWIDLAAARSIPEVVFRKPTPGRTPPLFSRRYMEVIALAIEQRRLTAQRAADLLDMTIDDLAKLCAAHGIEARFDS